LFSGGYEFEKGEFKIMFSMLFQPWVSLSQHRWVSFRQRRGAMAPPMAKMMTPGMVAFSSRATSFIAALSS